MKREDTKGPKCKERKKKILREGETEKRKGIPEVLARSEDKG